MEQCVAFLVPYGVRRRVPALRAPRPALYRQPGPYRTRFEASSATVQAASRGGKTRQTTTPLDFMRVRT